MQVVASRLQRCWATNISIGGMGLSGLADGTVPQPADDLELEFTVAEAARPIRVIGRVAWTSRVRADGRFGFGVQFRELVPGVRDELARFVAEHRPRVLVLGASPAERALARGALADVEVVVAGGIHELCPEHLRTCASVMVFARDASELTGYLDAVTAVRPEPHAPGELPLAPITVCTSAADESLAPLLARVYEVLRPPLDRRTLVLAVDRACERWALQVEVCWASLQLEASAQHRPRAMTPSDGVRLPRSSTQVVRVSKPMQRVYELIETVAVHDVPVLLTGETGTGKELAAREIHALSRRARTAFVAQDCGALTETLLESELFGHVRGAFTGATADHPGLFQIADGGTIFLDEIQNTSPALQAKLLRVVEQGEVRPVGGTKARRVDVRLIAACNVDLKQAIKEQRFRSDFYYRLNRFPIELPALRDHPDDILPLARYFATAICERLERPLHRIDPRTERALLTYAWPGNIRELRNAIERAILLTPPGEPLRWETLPGELRGGGDPEPQAGLDAQLASVERRLIELALERNDGVIRRAARDLEVNAITLARKMKRLGLGGR